MPAPRRGDTEGYTRASALAREVRANVAEQVAALVLEGDQAGSGEMLRMRVEQVVQVRGDIHRARGRQAQNEALGLPLAPAVRDEREAIEALRSAVMMVSVAAAAWVAAMDFESRRSELTITNGQARRKVPDEDSI